MLRLIEVELLHGVEINLKRHTLRLIKLDFEFKKLCQQINHKTGELNEDKGNRLYCLQRGDFLQQCL